jgi:hypothetical protein
MMTMIIFRRRPAREENDFFNQKNHHQLPPPAAAQHRRGPTKETDLDRGSTFIFTEDRDGVLCLLLIQMTEVFTSVERITVITRKKSMTLERRKLIFPSIIEKWKPWTTKISTAISE